MSMQDFTDTEHMDAVHEATNQGGTAESKHADQKASLKDESILSPDLIVEAWLESEIDATIAEASRFDRSYDTGVKFDSEPKENEDMVAELSENCRFEVDQRIGTEESEKESVYGLYYNGENGNNVPVLSVSDGVKPETDLLVEELFEDGNKNLLPEPHENQIVAEQCEVDHGLLENGNNFPVELLPSFSILETPICVEPETAIDERPDHLLVTDVSLRDDVEHEAFSRNATVEVQLLDNPSSEVTDIDASVVNASSISKDQTLDINSCVVDTTNTIHDQAVAIQNLEGETTTFRTDGMDTKHEDFIIIAENVGMPTEVVDRNSEYRKEISSAIGSSNASSIDVVSSEGDRSGWPITDCKESTLVADADYILEQDMGSEYLRKKRFFLVKMPNFDNLIVREQVRQAQLLVDEKTQLMDSLQMEIKMYKENCHADVIVHKTLMSKARASKIAVNSTRAEIDSLQSLMDRVKNALCVDNLRYRIAHLQHEYEHEPTDLKRRDEILHELRQCNYLRETLSNNIGDMEELQEALNNRDEIEGRLWSLRKDLDKLKDNYLKAEALAGAVRRRHSGEHRKLKDAEARFTAAAKVREETYNRMQSLKTEMDEMNQRFHNYKVDAYIAYDNAAKREIQELNILCFNQIERTMELWNTNPDFRKEYARFNMTSTVERLGTFDGRLLGPDEKPLVLSDYVYQLVDGHANPTEPSDGNGIDVASDNVEVEQMPNTEEELAHAEADLREQRRMEEKSKALEALMRKRKIAEKNQTRAELRAQKEAEHREKEKEKRLRKKQRRQSSASAASESNYSRDYNIALVYESDTAITGGGAKNIRSRKVLQQNNKAKSSIPPPALRNKGRKKLQQWIWLIVTCMVVILVFLVGNIGFFSALSDGFKGSTTGA